MSGSLADEIDSRAKFVRLRSIAETHSRKRLAGLPQLWAGPRRRYLTLLILAGFGQAAAAGVSARLFSYALTPVGASIRGLVFGVLVAAAVVVGLLRMAERVLAEKLSQDYVHEIRLGLIRRNLADGRVKSLGIAVARTTNDLTSVKNWISQGVAPLAVGIPLILGVGVVLVLLDPLLSIGLLVPVALLVSAMKVLAPAAYQRTRAVRRQRGRLSSQVADTLLSSAAIRSAGGSARELQRIDSYSQRLVAASIERAKLAGAMRGAAASSTAIATTMMIGIGLLAGLPTHSIAGALTIAGFLATPIQDLGRVVEYRQSYRAARRIIGPAIEPRRRAVPKRVEVTALPSENSSDGVGGAVRAAGLQLSDGTTMPELDARPGERVLVDAGNDRLTSEVLERFVGLGQGGGGEIVVCGANLAITGSKDFRRLVGYAARGMMLTRGTLFRTVRYRSPDSDPAEVERLLREVGLADRVSELDKGADTVLVHGGEPFTIPERARLLLARSILGDPPLLVFDHLDSDLGTTGRTMMYKLLVDYPGVVILASDDPDQIVMATHTWRPDGVHRILSA